jgi:hypothetical protein
MKQIPVYNAGPNLLPVGGMMIPPGETRHVPEIHVPKHLMPGAQPKQEAPKQDEILALLDGTIPEIIAALPGLSADDYARLKTAEENGKTRKGLLDAFAEEDLRRAAEQADEPEAS